MKDAIERALTILEIRREHNITSRAVAEAAGVEFRTEYLLEIGGIVERTDALKILQALSILTGKYYTEDNVAGLCITTVHVTRERDRPDP